jgi:tyrosyl-tRNA synthetase
MATKERKVITLTGDALIHYNNIVGELGKPGALAEVLDHENLKEKMASGKPIKVYWGTAPTGIPTIGYFCPMKKISDMLKAGWEVTILFADLHAFLDSMKSPLELVKLRTKVYENVIRGALEGLGVDHSKIKFVTGSSFQLTPEYQMDLFRLGNITTIRNAQKAGTEVVKQNTNPLVTSLLYPLMQALDEQYLEADIQFGGLDQRHVFTCAIEELPKIGYQKRIHLMNPIIPALSTVSTNGETVKMSSSDKNGKISLLDTPKEIQKKLAKVYCKPGDAKDNTLLILARELLFPILNGKNLVINRPEKYGGKLEYSNFKTMESDFETEKLSPVDLKLGVADMLINLTEPIRKRFESQEMQDLIKQAYPDK